jgi:hypothetical protein
MKSPLSTSGSQFSCLHSLAVVVLLTSPAVARAPSPKPDAPPPRLPLPSERIWYDSEFLAAIVQHAQKAIVTDSGSANLSLKVVGQE